MATPNPLNLLKAQRSKITCEKCICPLIPELLWALNFCTYFNILLIVLFWGPVSGRFCHWFVLAGLLFFFWDLSLPGYGEAGEWNAKCILLLCYAEMTSCVHTSGHGSETRESVVFMSDFCCKWKCPSATFNILKAKVKVTWTWVDIHFPESSVTCAYGCFFSGEHFSTVCQTAKIVMDVTYNLNERVHVDDIVKSFFFLSLKRRQFPPQKIVFSPFSFILHNLGLRKAGSRNMFLANIFKSCNSYCYTRHNFVC